MKWWARFLGRVEEKVDVPVPQTLGQIVSVPVPHVTEESSEVVKEAHLAQGAGTG